MTELATELEVWLTAEAGGGLTIEVAPIAGTEPVRSRLEGETEWHRDPVYCFACGFTSKRKGGRAREHLDRLLPKLRTLLQTPGRVFSDRYNIAEVHLPEPGEPEAWFGRTAGLPDRSYKLCFWQDDNAA